MAPQNPAEPSPAPNPLPESARHFRVLGWIVVLIFYLVAVFCLMQGLNVLRIFLHWDVWEAAFGSQIPDRAEFALYTKFWIAICFALIVIAYWAQRRLRRRGPAAGGST